MSKLVKSIATVALSAAMLTGCSTPESSAPPVQSPSVAGTSAESFKTIEPGVLTVAFPDFPYKGYIQGNDVTAPDSGYYVDMIRRVAKEMNLTLKYKKVDFTAFISGQIHDYDVAVDTLSSSPERQALFDISKPVVQFYKALFTRTSTNVGSKADVQNMLLGSGSTSVNFKYITDTIKPVQDPRGFAQDVDKYKAVAANQIDGALGDLYVSMAKTKEPGFADTKVACKFAEAQDGYWFLPKGSPLTQKVNEVIDTMTTDGTLSQLKQDYVIPLAGGGDPEAVATCPRFP